MDSFYASHGAAIVLGLAVVVALLGVWCLVTELRHRRLQQRFEAVLAAAESDNVPALLVEYLGTVRQVAARTAEMERRFDHLMTTFPTTVRHVGLVRFRAFHDTGGDQSFCLAVLDGGRNGVVVSALHSRQESRLFAKPIVAGSSRYVLTNEERQAIEQAMSPVGEELTVG